MWNINLKKSRQTSSCDRVWPNDIPRFSSRSGCSVEFSNFALYSSFGCGSLVYSGIYSSILRAACIALQAYCTREIKTAMYYPSPIESGFGVRDLQSRERISRFERPRCLPSARPFVIYGPCNANRKFILDRTTRGWFVFDRINIISNFLQRKLLSEFLPSAYTPLTARQFYTLFHFGNFFLTKNSYPIVFYHGVENVFPPNRSIFQIRDFRPVSTCTWNIKMVFKLNIYLLWISYIFYICRFSIRYRKNCLINLFSRAQSSEQRSENLM